MLGTHPPLHRSRATAVTRSQPFLAAALLAALLAPAFARAAQPADSGARVVWVNQQRVFIAWPDSVALEAGRSVTFLDKAKTIASGEITRVVERDFAIATLTSGALPSGRRLERVRVSVAPPALRPLALLRLGCPSAARAPSWFACAKIAARPPGPTGTYQADTWLAHSTRMLRDSAAVLDAPWPDTLLVRWFDDPADEEIALERGEIDAAVFWPGEPSSQIRELPDWRTFLFGTRSRGVVVASAPSAPDPAARAALDPRNFAGLNQELFRGDLAPCGTPGGRPAPSAGPPAVPVAAHYEVDSACPARGSIERFLNRAPSASGALPRVRLSFLGSPADLPDSLAGRATCVFRIRCPILCSASLRPVLSALGPGELADLMDCAPAEREP